MIRARRAESYPKLSSPRSPRTCALALVLALGIACQTVPVTGRQTVNLFTPADDVAIGREAFAQVLASEGAVVQGPSWERTERVFRRIVMVADDPGFEWEVALLEREGVRNAFALPGGKVVVTMDLLRFLPDDAGLAVVLGHEVGHCVARHSTERLTRRLPLEIGLSAVDLGEARRLAGLALDLSFLPFGRSQESEADEIGLVYMARAGYDPRRALSFWQEMAAASDDPQSPWGALFSTHPPHHQRIEDLRRKLPDALEVWRHAKGTFDSF